MGLENVSPPCLMPWVVTHLAQHKGRLCILRLLDYIFYVFYFQEGKFCLEPLAKAYLAGLLSLLNILKAHKLKILDIELWLIDAHTLNLFNS